MQDAWHKTLQAQGLSNFITGLSVQGDYQTLKIARLFSECRQYFVENVLNGYRQSICIHEMMVESQRFTKHNGYIDMAPVRPE